MQTRSVKDIKHDLDHARELEELAGKRANQLEKVYSQACLELRNARSEVEKLNKQLSEISEKPNVSLISIFHCFVHFTDKKGVDTSAVSGFYWRTKWIEQHLGDFTVKNHVSGVDISGADAQVVVSVVNQFMKDADTAGFACVTQ